MSNKWHNKLSKSSRYTSQIQKQLNKSSLTELMKINKSKMRVPYYTKAAMDLNIGKVVLPLGALAAGILSATLGNATVGISASIAASGVVAAISQKIATALYGKRTENNRTNRALDYLEFKESYDNRDKLFKQMMDKKLFNTDAYKKMTESEKKIVDENYKQLKSQIHNMDFDEYVNTNYFGYRYRP